MEAPSEVFISLGETVKISSVITAVSKDFSYVRYVPKLSVISRQRLLRWLRNERQYRVIFTAVRCVKAVFTYEVRSIHPQFSLKATESK